MAFKLHEYHRPSKGVSCGLSKGGRKLIITFPSRLVGFWDKVERFVCHIGCDEDAGKIQISPAAPGQEAHTFGVVRFESHLTMRVPRWDELPTHEQESISAPAFQFHALDAVITLPQWPPAPVVTENPGEGREDKQPAPVASRPATGIALRGPHPEVRQVTKNGAAIGHQPNSIQLQEADRQTEEARRLPPSKPSSTEPRPAWADKPREKPEHDITVKGKIHLIGNVLEAKTKVMSVRGGDERRLMQLLVNTIDGPPLIDEETRKIKNMPELLKSIRSKMATHKLPLQIVESRGQIRLEWRE